MTTIILRTIRIGSALALVLVGLFFPNLITALALSAALLMFLLSSDQ